MSNLENIRNITDDHLKNWYSDIKEEVTSNDWEDNFLSATVGAEPAESVSWDEYKKYVLGVLSVLEAEIIRRWLL